MRILSIAKNQKLANDLLNLNGDVVFEGNEDYQGYAFGCTS